MSIPQGPLPNNLPNLMAPQAAFRLAFVAKCHRLLALGYQTLDSANLQSAQETVITGLLVQAINRLIESDDAPQWMEPFIANDDPPQNSADRLGNAAAASISRWYKYSEANVLGFCLKLSDLAPAHLFMHTSAKTA